MNTLGKISVCLQLNVLNFVKFNQLWSVKFSKYKGRQQERSFRYLLSRIQSQNSGRVHLKNLQHKSRRNRSKRKLEKMIKKEEKVENDL